MKLLLAKAILWLAALALGVVTLLFILTHGVRHFIGCAVAIAAVSWASYVVSRDPVRKFDGES